MTIAIGRTEDKLQMAQENFGVDEIINISTEKLRDGIK
jgi:threonine dehydrogenase-like Zn-dependent dehydrogenase